ncbi:hypothetical protein [Streptomyces sp. BK340]|uniref:hypothetical protein n=1 Tax=Streptomyces sp. BK340 TaxID=2572903 RepID=UPI0011A886C7|nr:hypothetical protein [Streptomyces sp. BK340]TVZ94282.1 hypothetical protein FB157_105350 [Streptomyces sp. BK340]
MQWTNDGGGGYGEDPYGGVGYAYAYGHEYGGSATADTAPMPWYPAEPAPPVGFDTSDRPVPEPGTPTGESVRPVFVDSSGRRQRRVLRAARLLVVPAGGYVALLISTMLGGPSISSPFVPQSGAEHSAVPRATAPDSPPGTGRTAGSGGPAAARQKSGPAAQKTSSPTYRPAASTAPAATSAPTGTTSPASTTASAPTHTSKGRAVGSFHNPVK